MIKDFNFEKATSYIFKRLFAVLMFLFVAIIAYNIAFNHSRVRVFVMDAFTKRAYVVLENTDNEDLYNFYDNSFIENDEMINSQKYSLYNVSKYEYELKIESISVGWIAPKTATVVISEYIDNIKGQYNGPSEQRELNSELPPDWINAKYKIKMQKYQGRWFIVSMDKIKEIE